MREECLQVTDILDAVPPDDSLQSDVTHARARPNTGWGPLYVRPDTLMK